MIDLLAKGNIAVMVICFWVGIYHGIMDNENPFDVVLEGAKWFYIVFLWSIAFWITYGLLYEIFTSSL